MPFWGRIGRLALFSGLALVTNSRALELGAILELDYLRLGGKGRGAYDKYCTILKRQTGKRLAASSIVTVSVTV